MSEQSTSRHAVLTGAAGVAAAGVLMAVPTAAAVALGNDGDTPIQTLWRQYVACQHECERLSREDDLARERQIAATPPVPDELGLSEFEIHYYGLGDYRRSYRRLAESLAEQTAHGFTWVCAAGWQHAVERPAIPSESCPHHLMAGFRPRAREVLPIAVRYEAACERVCVESGYAATSAAWDAGIDRKEEVERAIMSTPAKTLDDLAIQGAIVKANDCECWVEELAASIGALAGGPCRAGQADEARA